MSDSAGQSESCTVCLRLKEEKHDIQSGSFGIGRIILFFLSILAGSLRE